MYSVKSPSTFQKNSKNETRKNCYLLQSRFLFCLFIGNKDEGFTFLQIVGGLSNKCNVLQSQEIYFFFMNYARRIGEQTATCCFRIFSQNMRGNFTGIKGKPQHCRIPNSVLSEYN
jgi:hypothetical protein